MTHVLFVAPASNLQNSREILRAAQGLQITVCDGVVDREKLSQYLYGTQYDIIHFASHGDQSVLQLSDGQIEVADLLIMLERQCKLQCVVITACISTRVASEIHNHMHLPTIACQIEIGDEAALAFTERFYRAFRMTNGDIHRAVDVGRATLQKDHPKFADAVFLINGDMLTDEERGELMRYVRAQIDQMSARLAGIEEGMRELRERSMRRMLIAIILLLMAELTAPFIMHWLM